MRYVITTLQIYIRELNQEICWLEVEIYQCQNCKGHYNDISLFRRRKLEMSNHSVATSSCKWCRMLGTRKSQCSGRNNERCLSEWQLNKQKPWVSVFSRCEVERFDKSLDAMRNTWILNVRAAVHYHRDLWCNQLTLTSNLCKGQIYVTAQQKLRSVWFRFHQNSNTHTPITALKFRVVVEGGCWC